MDVLRIGNFDVGKKGGGGADARQGGRGGAGIEKGMYGDPCPESMNGSIG